MDAERDEQEARENMYFERYPPVIWDPDLERLNKRKLSPQYSQICLMFCPKTNNVYYNKNSHGIEVGIIIMHLFVEFQFRYTYIHTR